MRQRTWISSFVVNADSLVDARWACVLEKGTFTFPCKSNWPLILMVVHKIYTLSIKPENTTTTRGLAHYMIFIVNMTLAMSTISSGVTKIINYGFPIISPIQIYTIFPEKHQQKYLCWITDVASVTPTPHWSPKQSLQLPPPISASTVSCHCMKSSVSLTCIFETKIHALAANRISFCIVKYYTSTNKDQHRGIFRITLKAM